MQIAKSKGSGKLAGSCEAKHHVLAAIQRVAMPGSTRSRQGQVRYPLQLTRRNISEIEFRNSYRSFLYARISNLESFEFDQPY